MRKFVLASIVAAFTAAGFLPAHAWDKASMNKTIDQTNVLLNNNCSGTIIKTHEGYRVLSANHCIASQFQDVEKDEIQDDGTVKKVKRRVSIPGTFSQLMFQGAGEVERTTYRFEIEARDEDIDLSLLKAKGEFKPKGGALLACKPVERGDIVYAVGNPYAVLYSSVSSGIVSSVQRDYRLLGIEGDENGDKGFIQHTAPIFGGNSGGALYNDKGDLVGVNVRGGLPTLSLAVPLEDIKDFLGKHVTVNCDGETPKADDKRD